MSALIDRCRLAGIRLWVEGGTLRYDAPKGAITPDLIADLRTNKPAILAALRHTRGYGPPGVPVVAPLGNTAIARQIKEMPLDDAEWAARLSPEAGDIPETKPVTSEVADLKEFFEDMRTILEQLAGLPNAELEAGRITATLARNRRYVWSSLRMALKDYPALLARVPDRDGVVDFLPLGVARMAVLKGKMLKQGEFDGPAEIRCADCAHFLPDAIGDGLGVGACAVDSEGSRPRGRWETRPSLWARGERRCADYEAGSQARNINDLPRLDEAEPSIIS
jgi:hypothetical protein